MPASGDDATATFRGVVTVSHHTFYLGDDGRFPSPPLPETTTGLVDAATDAAVIRTGIHTGVIDVTCQALSGPPPLDLAGWDAAAEIGIRASIGQVTVASLGFDLPEQFPVLTPAGPGEYRARVHARGRDTDIDGTASTPIELYLIQVGRHRSIRRSCICLQTGTAPSSSRPRNTRPLNHRRPSTPAETSELTSCGRTSSEPRTEAAHPGPATDPGQRRSPTARHGVIERPAPSLDA